MTIVGSNYSVVQYDTGSGAKFYGSGSYDIGRKDGSHKTWSPVSDNDIYRTGVEFNLAGAGIVRGSTITACTLLVTVNGSTYNAKIKSLDSMQSMTNAESLWLSIDQSGTTHFQGIPYGSWQREETSTAFKQAVQNHVYRGEFKVGIMSMSEGTDNTNTSIELSLRLTVNLPPSQVTIVNSFGGGSVKVDGNSRASGFTEAWVAGSTHQLEALDQEWPAGSLKQRSFYSGWKKRVGQQENSIGSSRSIPVTAVAGETATYTGVFKTHVVVSGTVTISTSYSLDPGTEVVCQSGSKVRFTNTLTAVGKSDSIITFTTPGGVSWQGIELDGGANSTLQYCRISHANAPIRAVNASNTSMSHVTIDSSAFYNGVDDAAMSFYGSSFGLTSITINGQSSSWNGIRFSEGSNGSLSYSTIRNCGAGNGIVIQGGANPHISHVTVQNNHYHGIILVNNEIEEPEENPMSARPIDASPTGSAEVTLPPPPQSGPAVIIEGCTITGNGVVGGIKTYVGVDAYNSRCDLTGNTISGSNYGIYADSYGYIGGGYGTVNHGANDVLSHNYGFVTYNYGWIVLGNSIEYNEAYGMWLYPGGCNRLWLNTYNVVAPTGTYVFAQGNWWGQYPPDTQKFSVSEGAELVWSPAMENEYDCLMEWGGQTAASDGELSEGGSEFDHAVVALRSGELAMARDLFRYVMDRASGERKKSALLGLYRALKAGSKSSAKEFVAALASRSGDLQEFAEDLLIDAYLSERDLASTKVLVNSIVTRRPKSGQARHALTVLASLKAYSRSESETSSKALNQLYHDFGDELDEGLIVALRGDPSRLSESSSLVEAAVGNPSVDVFPNPFNPSTDVRFTVTQPGHVRVEVFDLLGRLVEVLVNDARPAGVHTVSWNGVEHPSGMYILRFSASGFTNAKKLVLTK